MNKLSCLVLLGAGLIPLASADDQNLPAPTAHLQSLLELKAPATAPRALTIKGWKTLSGTKVLFIRTTELPMFDVHISFAAGSARDSAMPGLATATFGMLTEGVPGKDQAAIAETFDSLGAELNMEIDHARATFSLRSLSDPAKSTPALNLLTQIVGEPLLSEERLSPIKNELRAELAFQQDDAGHLSKQRIKTLLAPNSPYSHPVYGTEQGLAAITHSAVRNFHQQHYVAQTAQITLVGDLTLEQAKAFSLQISNALPAAGEPATVTASVSPAPDPVVGSHIERAQQQTHLLLAQPIVPRGHADYVALYAANLILGGTHNSRLMKELRYKHGLVYEASSEIEEWAQGSLLTLTLQTGAQFSVGTETLLRSLLSDFVRDGPTAEELDQLKRRLADMSAMSSASNRQIVARLVKINRHDLPLDLDYTAQQVQRLTLEDIRQALNKHVAADGWQVVTVGATVEQLPLPPVSAPSDPTDQHRCRVNPGFVAS